MNDRNKGFLPFFLQFINTAISEDMMTVNNSLENHPLQKSSFEDILSLNSSFLRFKLLIILTGYRCLTDGTRKTAKTMINPKNNLVKTMYSMIERHDITSTVSVRLCFTKMTMS